MTDTELLNAQEHLSIQAWCDKEGHWTAQKVSKVKGFYPVQPTEPTLRRALHLAIQTPHKPHK